MRAVHKALGSNLQELFSERMALVSNLQVLKPALLRSPMLNSSSAAPVCCPDMLALARTEDGMTNFRHIAIAGAAHWRLPAQGCKAACAAD